MRYVPHNLILCFALGFLAPVAHAQLSSSNYQVDVQYVGEEGGGYATSTNYQNQGSAGTPYDYSSESPTSEEGGNVTGSRVNENEADPFFPPSGEVNDVPGGGVAPRTGNGGQGDITQGVGEDPDSIFYGGRGNESEDDSSSKSPQEKDSIKETFSEGGASVVDHLKEMFNERPYMYSSIFLGLLLLLLFLLRLA